MSKFKLDVIKKAIQGGREFMEYSKLFGKESQAARKLIARDPYNGSAAMASHYSSIGTPITSYDIFNESGPALIKYRPTIQTRQPPFFVDYADKSKQMRFNLTDEHFGQLKNASKDLKARNAYIENALGLRRLPDGTPLDGQTIANLQAELEMNRGMIKELGTIERKKYIPRGVDEVVPETNLFSKQTQPTEFFVESPKGPVINAQNTEKKTYYTDPNRYVGSIETPKVEKSSYGNNKLVSKKERGRFGTEAAYATGDARHVNGGYSKVHRRQDANDWETLKNYKEYQAEAHRIEVKEQQGKDVKLAKKKLIQRYRDQKRF